MSFRERSRYLIRKSYVWILQYPLKGKNDTYECDVDKAQSCIHDLTQVILDDLQDGNTHFFEIPFSNGSQNSEISRLGAPIFGLKKKRLPTSTFKIQGPPIFE